MTDYDYKLLFTVAQEGLSKIRWSPAFAGLSPEQYEAKRILDILEEMKKVMNERD